MMVIKKLNAPTVALFAYLVKCLVLPIGYADSIIMTVLVAAYATKLHFDNKVSQKDSEQIRKELQDVKNAVNSLKLTAGQSGVKKKLF